MKFTETRIAGVYQIDLDVRGDERGMFKRQYCQRELAEAGLTPQFVQANHSFTAVAGTVRGMHYQLPPAEETKLVGCIVGRLLDVAVDLRAGSPTFLEWVGVELDPSRMLYVPGGCAHGFQTLCDDVHIHYMCSGFYTPELEDGVRHDDPAVGIEWPHTVTVLSERDRSFAYLDKGFTGIVL